MASDGESYNYQNLDPKYRKIAETELNESPERVRAHILSLRRWLGQCAHIKNCPDDDVFLLQFLRVSKFNQEKAQARLENYCTLRGSEERGLPHLFKRLPPDDPIIVKFLDMGIQVPLGFNDKGEFLILVRPFAFDTATLDMDKARPAMVLGAETFLVDERIYIAGVHVIFDLGDMSKSKMESIFNRRIGKENSRIFQDGFAMRQKGFYYYREPLLFDIVFKMLAFWLPPKIQRRLHRVKDDLKKLHEVCPGSKALLPKEYGGDAGPLEDCISRWKEQVRNHLKKTSGMPSIIVDESLRPKDSVKYLKQYAEYKGEMFDNLGTKGTYTKIDAM